jgi:phosphoglycerol transferase MdoB-like AlkP superfamily enzyme
MGVVEAFGTAFAVGIAVLGSMFVLWFSWPDRHRKTIAWRLAQLSVLMAGAVLALFALLIYGALIVNEASKGMLP